MFDSQSIIEASSRTTLVVAGNKRRMLTVDPPLLPSVENVKPATVENSAVEKVKAPAADSKQRKRSGLAGARQAEMTAVAKRHAAVSWSALRGVAQLTRPTAHCDYDQMGTILGSCLSANVGSVQLSELMAMEGEYGVPQPCPMAVRRNAVFIQSRGHWITRIIIPSLQTYRACTETTYLACYYFDRYCLQRIIPSGEWADLVALTAALLAMKVSEEVDPEVDRMRMACRGAISAKASKAAILGLERRMVDLFRWQLHPPTTHGLVYACLDSLGLESMAGIAPWKQWVACLADRILHQYGQEHSFMNLEGKLLLSRAVYAALGTVLSDRVLVHSGWRIRLKSLLGISEEPVSQLQAMDALDLRLSGPRRPFHPR